MSGFYNGVAMQWRSKWLLQLLNGFSLSLSLLDAGTYGLNFTDLCSEVKSAILLQLFSGFWR